MTYTDNIHLALLQNFYIKKNDLDIKLSVEIPKKSVPVKQPKDQVDFSWNFPNTKNLMLAIPSQKDDLTGEDLSKLNNVSFIHSLLYLTDPTYYSGLTSQKRADCAEFIEILRKDFHAKQKISKETANILQNIENNSYIDLTIQHIINFLNSVHLIIFSNDPSRGPKLFINGHHKSKKTPVNHKSAGAIIMMYFDQNREIYYPIMYKEDCMYITWKDDDFLQFIKNVYLWGKPLETKKWSVADLRDWIAFFELPIDPSLAKNLILEKMPEKMSST